MAYKYKNDSGVQQLLMGHGTVEAGDEIVTDLPIENPNFTYISEVQDTPDQPSDQVEETEQITNKETE